MKNKEIKIVTKAKVYILTVLVGTFSAFLLGLIMTQMFLGYSFNMHQIIKILLVVLLIYSPPSIVLNLSYLRYNGHNNENLIIPHVLCVVLYLILIIVGWEDGGDASILTIMFALVNIAIGVYIFINRIKIFHSGILMKIEN